MEKYKQQTFDVTLIRRIGEVLEQFHAAGCTADMVRMSAKIAIEKFARGKERKPFSVIKGI